ncbi:MAG: hypothetical protein AAF611_04395 [Bacteroidota bacterium]
MLQQISTVGTLLNKKQQSQIKGRDGMVPGMVPINPTQCRYCSGEWLEDFGLCALPIGYPCGL